MNGLLAIRAICCLFAFAVLSAVLHGTAIERGPAARNSPPSVSDRSTLVSIDDAQELVASLVGEYQRPWKQRESAPYRLYSRVAPRPIPSISAEIQWASSNANSSDGMLLATIDVRAGTIAHCVPCVIDRTTSQARFFAGNRWLTADEWLQGAPLP
jgi:hypothetical protein